jgi:uncharacterized integral membrane protein
MKELLRKIRLFLMVVAALLVLIVVLQNTQTVETKILTFTLEMPRAALLLGTLSIGYVLGALTAHRIIKKKE